MSHKKNHQGPIPADNQSPFGTGGQITDRGDEQPTGEVGSAQEQDPKRRLGDYEGKGEHAFQQPGGKNDANR